MQRTIKIKLNPTQKKRDEVISTMVVYKETVNRFLSKFSRYQYIDKLNYKCLYEPEGRDKRIASNYSTNALAYAVSLLKNRLRLIKKNCKARIYEHIKDKEERHYLFYLLKQPKYIKAIMQRKKFIVEKEFKVTRQDYLNRYLHRILRHEFRNNKIPELRKLLLRTDINTARLEEYEGAKQFSHALKLSTTNKGKRLVIPCKSNRWAERFISQRKGCFIVCLDEQNNLNLHIPIEEEGKENINPKEVGIDIGFRKLIVDSNGNRYGKDWHELEKKLDEKFQEKQKQRNKLYGHRRNLYRRWEGTRDRKIYKKIKRIEKYNLGKKKFDKNRTRTKETIKNNVNRTVNEFAGMNPQLKKVMLERLDGFSKTKTYNKKSNRLLNQWRRGFLKKKIIFISRFNSIELAYQNPAYTSQTCPDCGYVSRDNRRGEGFACIRCGFSEDADVVGALNTKRREGDSEIGLYTPYKKVKEILLKRYSVGEIMPPRLEMLNPEGCESCKQSIQEQNTILATGGEECCSAPQ